MRDAWWIYPWCHACRMHAGLPWCRDADMHAASPASPVASELHTGRTAPRLVVKAIPWTEVSKAVGDGASEGELQVHIVSSKILHGQMDATLTVPDAYFGTSLFYPRGCP